MAQDRDTQDSQAHRPPLSAHPAFPLIVGLWFAALLGLGTIVLPAVVLEQVAGLTGLVEAPLSAAARAVIALLATIIGLVGGLALARRVSQAQQSGQPQRRRAAKRAGSQVRPLSVHDDLGEEAIAPTGEEQRPATGRRRRALTVIEDERPSDFLMAAPLPGDDVAQTPELPTDEDAMSERPSDFETQIPAEPASEELDLSNLVAESPIYDSAAEPQPADVQAFEPEPYVPALDTRKPRDFSAPPAPDAAMEAEELVVEPIDAPLEDLGIVQLAERLGRSMQKRLAAIPAPAPEPVEAAPEAEALEFSAPSLEPSEPEETAFAVPAPVVPDSLRAFMDEAPADITPQPVAEEELIAVPPPVVPAALQAFTLDGFDTEDDDDLDPGPFTLPLDTMAPRPFDAPAMAPTDEIAEFEPIQADASDEEDETDDPLADESYSSLLSMKNPFRTEQEEFVRIDEPEAEDDAVEPAVVFPGQETAAAEPAPAPEAEADEAPTAVRPFDAPHQPAPSTAPVQARKVPDPVETERALRSALANLQRMSGAA